MFFKIDFLFKISYLTMNTTVAANSNNEFIFTQEVRLNNFRNYKPVPNVVSLEKSCVWNLDSQQDHVWEYVTKELTISMVCDGHGRDNVINYLRSLSDEYLLQVCQLSNPFDKLENDMENCINTFDSGACISIVRTNNFDKLEVFWIGDTMTQVYKNGIKIAQTESHTGENKSEYERKLNEGAIFTTEMGMYVLPEITNNPHITMNKIKRCVHNPKGFMNKECLQITRSSGHKAFTSKPGENYGYMQINFDPSDDIKIITASDGVWDVIHTNENISFLPDATDLVLYAAERWCGDWNYIHHSEHRCKKCKCKKNNEIILSIEKGIPPDDISASLIHLPSI